MLKNLLPRLVQELIHFLLKLIDCCDKTGKVSIKMLVLLFHMSLHRLSTTLIDGDLRTNIVKSGLKFTELPFDVFIRLRKCSVNTSLVHRHVIESGLNNRLIVKQWVDQTLESSCRTHHVCHTLRVIAMPRLDRIKTRQDCNIGVRLVLTLHR